MELTSEAMLSLMTITHVRKPHHSGREVYRGVTHVLVNDPTKGYGIFIENMLDAAT